MDAATPMDEARNGLEGGADLSGAVGGMDVYPRRPHYSVRYGPSYTPRHTWRARSGPAPARLAPDRFAYVAGLVREYQGIRDKAARATFRTDRIDTLSPEERKKFWYLFFRNLERTRGRAAFEKQKASFPRRLRNAAYMSNVSEGQVLHMSAAAIAYLSVVTSPFINPSNMPGHQVKIPSTDSDPGRNSACVCVRSYRTYVVPPAGGPLGNQPIVFVSTPRPDFVTGGLPVLCSLDWLPHASGYITSPAFQLSYSAADIARKFPMAFYAQMDAVHTAERSRVVGHGMKIWVQPPAALAAQGPGQLSSFVCDTRRFLTALGDQSMDAALFDTPPASALYLPMAWAQYGTEYNEYLVSLGTCLASAAEESTMNPMYNVRDAARGVTLRYHPSLSETKFSETNFGNLAVYHYSESQRSGTQLIPPQAYNRAAYATAGVQGFSTAFCGPPPAASYPFQPSTDVSLGPLFTAIAPASGTAFPITPTSDMSFQFMLGNGNSLSAANTLVGTYLATEPTDVMTGACGSNILVASLANAPPGSTITVQQVWHFECETTANSVLNMDATPEIVDPGWNNILAIMDVRNVFPVIVDGHSFWDDITDAFSSAGNWIVGAYDTATGWVNRAINGVENAVEQAAPFVEKAMPWIELGASLL